MKKNNYYNGLYLTWALLLVFSADIIWAQNDLSDFRTKFKTKLTEHRNQMRTKDAHEHTFIQYTPSISQIVQKAWRRTNNKSIVCPAGDVFLANQDDVDAFGALGCTEVTGNLILDDSGYSPEITDITPLSSLTSVTGIFQITASQLSSLAGLSNLSTVGYLHIIGCNALTNLNGLSGLMQCTGPVVDPCSCAAEQNHIQHNSSLINFAGLSNLSSVNSGLFIHNNAALQNANGLSGLTYVGGALAFQDNPSLTNLNALSNLTTVVRDLVVRRCHALKNFSGLQDLNSVGSWVVIDDNNMLKNMEGLSGLTSIAGRLWAINNDALKNLEGLSALSAVGGEVWIENNAVIKNLEGMSSLTMADGVVALFNPLLKNLNGISSLTSVGGGGLVFFQNPSLQNVDAISNVTTVGGWLLFEDLPALKNIDGASNITWVGGVAGIATCPLVENVDGFSNITFVGLDVGALNMASLENVDGFSNVTWVGGALLLFDNPVLTRCCGMYHLLCTDPPGCSADAVGGPVIIFNNGAGCSEAEIIAGGPCAPSMASEEGNAETLAEVLTPNGQLIELNPLETKGAPNNVSALSLAPNPFNVETNISFKLDQEEHIIIGIYNLNGQLVDQLVSEIMPAGSHKLIWNGDTRAGQMLENGIYFVTLKTNEQLITEKVSLVK